MNAVDIAVGVVLLASGVFALVRGFVHEVLAMAGWVVAPLAAFWIVNRIPAVHDLAHRFIDKDPYADIAAGIAIFIVVLILLSVFTHAISRRVQQSALGSVDRALGFAFGLVRGLVLCSLAYMVVAWLIPSQPQVMLDAKTLPLMQRGAEIIQALVPEHMAMMQERTREAARTAEQLKETKEMYDRLQAPQPRPAEQASDKLQSYDDKGLERLIENGNGSGK